MPRLPLFPLGTVLVPGAELPLQIFEPRYVVLLSDLVHAMETPEFGVVAIRQGHEVGVDAVRDLYDVGCVAHVRQAVAVADGRFLVLSEGRRRFRLDAIDTGAGTAYLTGSVTWLEEPDGDTDSLADLASRVLGTLTAYARLLGADAPQCPEEPRELSYAVGTAVGLDLTDRQRLLAASDTAARLRLGLRLVQREYALASRLGVVPQPPESPPNLN